MKRIAIGNWPIWVGVAGLAALCASGALNLLLFGQAKKYYLELNQTRLDPLGLSYYSEGLPENISEDLSESLPGSDSAASSSWGEENITRVVFYGDSRAEGWRSPDMKTADFLTRGISSQTSAQSQQRFSAHMSSLKPDVVVIQLGINDLKTVALFPERKRAIVENCKANIKQIVEDSQKQGAVVILTTVFPVGRVPLARRPFWSNDIEIAVRDVNDYIATLAEEDVLIFDAFSLLANKNGKMKRRYQIDELHLNKQGYDVLNQKLVPLIESLKMDKN
jgi:lysophospholipase L1-like esterase